MVIMGLFANFKAMKDVQKIKNGGTAYTIRYAQKKELDCRIVSTVLSNNP